jgi:hypothetical protein
MHSGVLCDFPARVVEHLLPRRMPQYSFGQEGDPEGTMKYLGTYSIPYCETEIN